MPNRTPKPPKSPFTQTHRSGKKFSPKDSTLAQSKARTAGPPPTAKQVAAGLKYPVGRMGYVRGLNKKGRGGHDEYL